MLMFMSQPNCTRNKLRRDVGSLDKADAGPWSEESYDVDVDTFIPSYIRSYNADIILSVLDN